LGGLNHLLSDVNHRANPLPTRAGGDRVRPTTTTGGIKMALKEEQTERISDAVVSADFDEMTFDEFIDLFEDRDPSEFI
jgi:hypothetical protein